MPSIVLPDAAVKALSSIHYRNCDVHVYLPIMVSAAYAAFCQLVERLLSAKDKARRPLHRNADEASGRWAIVPLTNTSRT